VRTAVKPSNSKSPYCVPPRIMWLLQLPFDQNSIMINHKPNGDCNSHIILGGTQEGHKMDLCITH
jgi:hypothetical protein